MTDIFIFVPILFLKYLVPLPGPTVYKPSAVENFVITLIGVSRYLRMINFGLIMQKYHRLGSTDVDR